MKQFQLLLYLLIFLSCTHGQQPAGNSLKELLQLAETNYPLLKSKALDVQAAQKKVEKWGARMDGCEKWCYFE